MSDLLIFFPLIFDTDTLYLIIAGQLWSVFREHVSEKMIVL